MLQELSPFIIPIITAIVGWFASREKTKRELKSSDIANEGDALDNEIKSADYYEKLLDNLSKRLEKAIEELTLSEENNRNLVKMNSDLIISNQKLIDEIQKLQATNKEMVEELQKFKQLNGKNG